jgi:hypothetical protein
MSSKKDQREEEKGLQIDFKEFETQLEDEIDKLFIPAENAHGGDGEGPGLESGNAQSAKDLADVKPVPVPEKEASPPEQSEAPSLEPVAAESGKDASEGGLGQFEDLLDSEVDRLFVPAEQEFVADQAQSAPEARKEPVGLELESETLPLPSSEDFLADLPASDLAGAESQPGQAVDQQSPGDTSEFELQLDTEIDRLFVPVEGTPLALKLDEFAQPTVPSPAVGARSTPSAAPPVAGAVPPLPGQGSVERKVPRAVADKKTAGKDDAAKEVKPEPRPLVDQRELTALVESLTIAFLSLDWEFSQDNIAKMNEVLKKLEPYSSNVPETKSLSKMLKAVLHFLKTKTRSTSPQMIEFLHQSHELMKSMLLSQGNPSPAEKQQLKKLIADFKSMGGKAASSRRAMRLESAGMPPQPMSRVEAVSPETPWAVTPSADSTGDGVRRGLSEAGTGTGSFHSDFKAALDGIETENRRLRGVREATRKSSTLAPLTSRLGSISSLLEKHVAMLRQYEEDLLDLQSSIGVVPGDREPDSRQAAGESPEEAGGTRREQYCLFNIGDKRFAVPAQSVVKFSRVSSKKASRISERGYATINDLKPFFGRLFTGVLGNWRALPDEALSACAYAALPVQLICPSSPAPASSDGVILFSDGRNHRMLFSDFSAISLQTETMTARTGDKYVIGLIHPEAVNPVQVLDIERLLEDDGNRDQEQTGQ